MEILDNLVPVRRCVYYIGIGCARHDPQDAGHRQQYPPFLERLPFLQRVILIDPQMEPDPYGPHLVQELAANGSSAVVIREAAELRLGQSHFEQMAKFMRFVCDTDSVLFMQSFHGDNLYNTWPDYWDAVGHPEFARRVLVDCSYWERQKTCFPDMDDMPAFTVNRDGFVCIDTGYLGLPPGHPKFPQYWNHIVIKMWDSLREARLRWVEAGDKDAGDQVRAGMAELLQVAGWDGASIDTYVAAFTPAIVYDLRASFLALCPLQQKN